MTQAELAGHLNEYHFEPETTVTGAASGHWRVAVRNNVFRVFFNENMWVLYKDGERVDYGFKLLQLADKIKGGYLDPAPVE